MRAQLTTAIALLIVSFSVVEWAESEGGGCVYCNTNTLSGFFLCDGCSEPTAQCVQFVQAASYVCCSPNVSNEPCSSAAFDPDVPGYRFRTATGPCDPLEVCQTCPTNLCIHFSGGSSCMITGSVILTSDKGRFVCFLEE